MKRTMDERDSSRLYYLADALVFKPKRAGEIVRHALRSGDSRDYREAVELLLREINKVSKNARNASEAATAIDRAGQRLLRRQKEIEKDVGQALLWAIQHRRSSAGRRTRRLAQSRVACDDIDLLEGV